VPVRCPGERGAFSRSRRAVRISAQRIGGRAGSARRRAGRLRDHADYRGGRDGDARVPLDAARTGRKTTADCRGGWDGDARVPLDAVRAGRATTADVGEAGMVAPPVTFARGARRGPWAAGHLVGAARPRDALVSAPARSRRDRPRYLPASAPGARDRSPGPRGAGPRRARGSVPARGSCPWISLPRGHGSRA